MKFKGDTSKEPINTLNTLLNGGHDGTTEKVEKDNHLLVGSYQAYIFQLNQFVFCGTKLNYRV